MISNIQNLITTIKETVHLSEIKNDKYVNKSGLPGNSPHKTRLVFSESVRY